MGTADADMDVTEAWDLSTGAGQTVAVVDTGVDRTHPDLAGQSSAATTSSTTTATRRLRPDDGHGTHVAGTIAAARDNGKGVAGVAPDSILVPLRALGAWQRLDVETAEAFDWAGDHGVRIVNAEPRRVRRVARRARRDRRPSGDALRRRRRQRRHDNVDSGRLGVSRAPTTSPNVLCVGASDPNDARGDFSNYGATRRRPLRAGRDASRRSRSR